MTLRTSTIENLLRQHPRGRHIHLSLAYSVEAGLPVSALDLLAAAVAPKDARFKFRLIPTATLERRRGSTKRFTTEEGDRLARSAKVHPVPSTSIMTPRRSGTSRAALT